MHCPTCPSDRHAHCRGQGCHAASAVPVAPGPGPGAGGDLDVQVGRLDVENGDILVVRTRRRLTPGGADAIHDQVAALASRHGVRDVTVMVLDDCSDLAVERPGPSLVQKPASVGRSDAAPLVFHTERRRPGGSEANHVRGPSAEVARRPSPAHPVAYDGAFVEEAQRIVAYAKATGDYRRVTHHHAMAAVGQMAVEPDIWPGILAPEARTPAHRPAADEQSPASKVVSTLSIRLTDDASRPVAKAVGFLRTLGALVGHHPRSATG